MCFAFIPGQFSFCICVDLWRIIFSLRLCVAVAGFSPPMKHLAATHLSKLTQLQIDASLN
jgi:hypothetical protein